MYGANYDTATETENYNIMSTIESTSHIRDGVEGRQNN